MGGFLSESWGGSSHLDIVDVVGVRVNAADVYTADVCGLKNKPSCFVNTANCRARTEIWTWRAHLCIRSSIPTCGVHQMQYTH